MKALLFFIVLLLPTITVSQKRMVLIEGFQEHKIEVSDSVTEDAVKDFYGLVYVNRIDYETKLKELKAVITVPMSKARLHYYDRGVIYISSYADKFPYSKQVIIWHELGLFYGAKATKGSSLDVMNENFYLTDKYEKNYKYRKKFNVDLKLLIKELEETARLKTN